MREIADILDEPEIHQSIINVRDGVKTKYQQFCIASEMFRLILNGFYSSRSNIANLDGDTILNNNPINDLANGHCNEWNELKKRLNSKEKYDFRQSILDYYNLIQGDSASNEYLNRTQFNQDVREVAKTGLIYSNEDVQLDDPVNKRRKYSEYLLNDIIAKIPAVVKSEKNIIQEQLSLCRQFIDIDEIESGEDIEEIANIIMKFYDGAQDNSLTVYDFLLKYKIVLEKNNYYSWAKFLEATNSDN